jgi:hypothetical protein
LKQILTLIFNAGEIFIPTVDIQLMAKKWFPKNKMLKFYEENPGCDAGGVFFERAFYAFPRF